jgi:predicted nucleic acid-binding protein
VIDASVLISAWLPSDVNHVASRAWLARHLAAGRATVLPSLALTEVAGGPRRRTGDRVSTRRAVRHLLALPGVRIADLDRRLMWRATLVAATVGLRGADAVYVVVADQVGAPLVTWNADQHARAALAIAVTSPPTDTI